MATVRIAVQRNDDDRALQSLDALYRTLLAPLETAGFVPEAFDRIIVVPHGPLSYVPFSALRGSDGRFLIQRVGVTLAPSASVWFSLRERPKPGANQALIVSNPALASPGLPALREADVETDSVAASLGAISVTVYRRDQASESRFREAAPRAHIVHLATHGDFPEQSALDFHRLLLAPDAAGDGHLVAAEIRHLDLSRVRLVVLSVCNGGVYRSGPGSEPYGLIPALLVAGVENVVASQWSIDDLSGRRFMTRFYRHLLRSDPADAIRQTAMALIAEGEPIRDWAAFLVVGPARRIH